MSMYPLSCTSNFSPLVWQGGSRICSQECMKLPIDPTKRSLTCLVLQQWQTLCTLWCFLFFTHFLCRFLQDGGGAQLIHLYIKELPLWWWWEEVDSNGGLMSVQSAGSSWGMKGCLQQSCVPLHMVPPPTGLSPFSSLCRHQCLPGPGCLVPVEWHWP